MPERLRIAQITPMAAPVRPDSPRSIEQLVWLLAEELVRRGHEVTLFATGDSQTSANLHAIYPRGYEADADLWNWQFHETMHVAAAFERAREFDVIHSHVYHFALPFTRLVDTPVVHTYHILPDEDVVRAYARCPEARVVAISEYQRRAFNGASTVAIVHHGIDTDAFPFGSTPGDYLVFLGQLTPNKGATEAIRVARRAGMRLILAGRSDAESDYFRSAVAPLIDGREIEYVGPVAVRERNALLAGAAALVYPIVAPEPFGLVTIEAMACGTPVVAHGLGAVPEIVENGVSGYSAPRLDLLAARVPATLALDRARVRQAAMTRFDYRRMVDGYERVYRRLANGQRSQRG